MAIIVLLFTLILIFESFLALVPGSGVPANTFMHTLVALFEITAGLTIFILIIVEWFNSKAKTAKNSAQLCLFFGIVLVLSGMHLVIFGDSVWWGILVPSESGWLEMLLGVSMCMVAVKDLKRYAAARPKEGRALDTSGRDADSGLKLEVHPAQAAHEPNGSKPDADKPDNL